MCVKIVKIFVCQILQFTKRRVYYDQVMQAWFNLKNIVNLLPEKKGDKSCLNRCKIKKHLIEFCFMRNTIS